MEVTQSLVDQQVDLERTQINQGLKRLHSNTYKLEDRSYASASVYGIASIETLLPLVVKRIEDTNDRIHERHNGVAFKDIHKYLATLEPLAAGAIACKITIDKVFSYQEGSNKMVNICSELGSAIEAEVQMRYYEETAPALLTTLKKNYWHKACGTHQKVVIIKTLMNRYNVTPWKVWPRDVRVRLGGWLLDCVMEASQWFYKLRIRQHGKLQWIVVPTAEFLDIKDEVMANAELFSPLAWPMLIPPNDWEYDEHNQIKQGGYVLNEIMKGHDLVRRGNPYCIQGETPLTFINKIQKVGYRLNPFTVDIALRLEKLEINVGKFLPTIHYDLPPKPPNIAEDKDARKSYRRAAAEIQNKRKAETRRSCRTRMTLEAIKRFKDVDRYYLPWSFDYRGRSYPIPAFLTPQDTDFGKSLLNFADEIYLTEDSKDWLAFQVSTCYGLDKATIKERIEWPRIKENEDIIRRVAEDPINNIGDWEGAAEPWQFAAACNEYYHCVLIGDKETTGLMIAVDATCSGLQILAGLAMDESTAKLVNVIPSDRPQDAYALIAEKSKPNIPEILHEHWDRKCVKRTVMTIPYNAKPFSNRSYIRDALKEKGIEIEKDDLTITVAAVRDAMNEVVPGPMAVMKWIETEVAKAIKRGATHLEWVTPSGFVVIQRLMKKKVETIDLKLLGRCRLSVATEDGPCVDRTRHKAATAPNLIHSLDASLLHLVTERFDAPIALIHDSVLSRATDMSLLAILVRETYMHLFAERDYLTEFAQQIGAETEPPIIDDLEPKSVIDSTYFFC